VELRCWRMVTWLGRWTWLEAGVQQTGPKIAADSVCLSICKFMSAIGRVLCILWLLCIGACWGTWYINNKRHAGLGVKKNQNKQAATWANSREIGYLPKEQSSARQHSLQATATVQLSRLNDWLRGLIKLATCKHAALCRDSDTGCAHYLSPRSQTKHLQGTARPRNKQNTKANSAYEYSKASQGWTKAYMHLYL